MDNNLSITQSLKPNIKKYVDVYQFLIDYFDYRRKIDPQFSYEIWAAELGFKSRIFMYLISQRKRSITSQFIDRFALHIKMTEAEKNYFLLLASYEKIKSTHLKATIYDKILEVKENKEKIFNGEDYFQFVSSHTMPLIKMILAFDDIQGTIPEISSLLNMTEAKISHDLHALEKIGFVTRTYKDTSAEIFWKSTSKAFQMQSDKSSCAIKQKYNELTLTEAQTINQQNDIFKKFRSILFAINPENHQDMASDIDSFVVKMKNKYGCDELNNKNLMQVNVQAYPVTRVFKK